MRVIVTQAPTTEPLGLDETKLYLRLITELPEEPEPVEPVAPEKPTEGEDPPGAGEPEPEPEEYTAEDGFISALIVAAREYCEAHTGRALAEQTCEALLPAFPCEDVLFLPRSPLVSVESVKYRDRAGTVTELSASTDYIADASDRGSIIVPYGRSWPRFDPYPINAVRIEFKAGYNDENPCPESIKRAMLFLIGHWYENREAVVIGAANSTSREVDLTVKTLLNIWRVRWF